MPQLMVTETTRLSRIEVSSEKERTIVLRGQTKDEVDALIEKGYAWLEKTGLDMVEALHAERRKARRRERRNR